MCRRGPLTVADDGQSGAVNDEGQAGARAGAPKREGEMLTASRERGVIGCREIDAQHPEDRGQDALGLTQRSVEEETERQGGFDGEIGILELPAPPADASRCPRGDRVGREPEGDVASPHEGSVVLGPVPDAIRCLVLRMHSRLHIEIMTRRRSRWSTCRPLLAHRAESAHQRQPEDLRRLCQIRIDELEGFIDGLFGDEEAIELPERAHEALENLREINAMPHGIIELLGRQPAPPASADDVAGTLRNVRELSRIAEQELHAVILACTRARQHRLATSTMTKPTIH